jgi:hypothetical protein
MENRSRRRLRFLFWVAGLGILFALYTSGIKRNPPGFYLDESAPAYNAYLVAHTGAGEFGPRFPLYFQYYTDTNTQVGGPVQVYMLATLFRFLPPSVLLARMFSAFWVFSACILLGLLARRISGRRIIGFIVAVTALVTPWFFEGRGLLLEPQFVPMALAPFLLMLYHLHKRESWNWVDVGALAASLTLVTYCYTSGRVLGPLLALGLLIFATSRQRLVGVIKTGLLYGLTLVPILLYNRSHPGVLTKRLAEISYIKPGVPLSDVLPQFIKRYLEDQSLMGLLVNGDYHPRHHVPGSGGAFFYATFILVLIGLAVILARRWRDPWWRFILYGLAVAVVPGAISVEPFHGLRLMAYPVFLLLLTVPALEWLLARPEPASSSGPAVFPDGQESLPENGPLQPAVVETGPPRWARVGILCVLLAVTGVEAYRFQVIFRRDGPNRTFDFDVNYKTVYDAAVKQPARPIYLEDGMWGPAYIHAFWYATVEKRPTSQFVHLTGGARPPSGAIVISSAEGCQNCSTLMRAGVYQLYKVL